MEKNGKRILVIDDDADYVIATETVLGSAGYSVAHCYEAEKALDAAAEFRPDLIILDVMMETGTAGFEVSYRLRRHPRLAGIPILMVTAIHQTTPLRFSPETDGEYLPVQEVLDKPVPPEKLLQEVSRHLAQVGA